MGRAASDAVGLNNLWQRTRATLAASSVRDARYLSWRYDRDPVYERLALYDSRRMAAAAVVRRPRETGDPRLGGIKVATLSEVIFPVDEPASGEAAIAAAEQTARRMGADAMLCGASHPALAAILKKRGYLRPSGNLHFMLRDPGRVHELPASLGAWWLTRGDALTDQMF
jgi:hypothetical protein